MPRGPRKIVGPAVCHDVWDFPGELPRTVARACLQTKLLVCRRAVRHDILDKRARALAIVSEASATSSLASQRLTRAGSCVKLPRSASGPCLTYGEQDSESAEVTGRVGE